MSNQIRLKRGSGSNPSASDLVVGEVALRTDNGKLFTKKDDNSITEIGSGISDGDKGDITISNSGGTFTIDNGAVTSAKILDGTITNADINASAAIAGSKISPVFGSQDIKTTGNIKAEGASSLLQVGDTGNDNFVQLSQETSSSSVRGFTNQHSNASVLENLQGTTNQHLVLGDVNNDNTGALFGVSITQGGNIFTRLSLSGSGNLSVHNSITSGGGINVGGNLTVDTNTLFVDSSNNRVGIGTTSPDADLHISTAAPTLRFTDTDTSRFSQIHAVDGNLRFDADNSNAQSSTNIAFRTDGSERMRIDSSGHVGIGMTPSGVRLDVQSSVNDIARFTGPNSGGITIRNDTSHEVQIHSGNSDALIFGTNGENERMRITSAGNLGIGTSSPDNILHLESASNPYLQLEKVGTSSKVFVGNASGEAILESTGGAIKLKPNGRSDDFVLSTSGLLGIGTASPATKLHVSSSGDTVVRVTSADGNAAFLDLGDASDPDGGRIHYDTGSNLVFNTASSERLRIDSSGNVGIGTSSPAVRLEVEDTISATFSADNSITAANQLLKLENLSSNSFAGIHFRTAGGGDGHFGTFQNTSSANDCTFYFSNQIDSGGGQLLATLDSQTGNFIVNKGKIGIGTTSPSVTLDIEATTPTIRLTDSDASGTPESEIRGGGGDLTFSADRDNENLDTTMTFEIDGSEKMRLDSSGRLLIGTTASVGSATDLKLQVFHSSNGSIIFGSSNVSSSGTAAFNFAPSNKITGSQILCEAEEDFSTSAKRTARLVFKTRKDGTLAERMGISSSGLVTLDGGGNSHPWGATFRNDGESGSDNSVRCFFEGANGQSNRTYSIMSENGKFRISGGGTAGSSTGSQLIHLASTTATSWTGGSDERLKENITEIPNVLDKIKNYRCARFNFIGDDPSDIQNVKFGFIAQDWLADFPEVISKSTQNADDSSDTTEYYGMQYTETIPVLMKAIQELITKVGVLETEVAALKAG